MLLDAYVEEKGSRCLRRLQNDNGDRLLTRLNAMDECSKNKRCVGIELVEEQEIVLEYAGRLFKPCIDSTYKSTARDKYEKLTNKIFKKASNYGKCTGNEAT